MSTLPRRLAILFGIALAGVLGHGLVRLATKAYAYLHSPYVRDYGEGCVLMMVQVLDQRGSYFLNLRDYPFVHGNYPPLFIALVWPFYRLFGPSIFVPRLLSLLATLGLLGVIYALGQRLAPSRWAAAGLTGVAVCPWFFQTWAPMGRVDMLAFLLTFAGLLAFVRGGRLGVAFPLFWLAFFTKQNALVAPAALLLHILLSGAWRRFLSALAGFTLPLLLLFGALDVATGGEAFRHLVTYTAAAVYEWDRMVGSYVEFVRISWPLLMVIAAALARNPRRFGTGHPRLFLIYWALNLVSLATIAKAGAAQNYFIEPWLATVVLAAASLSVIAGEVALPLASQAAALLLAASVALYTSNWAHRLPGAIRHPEQARDFAALWETVRATQGPILSDNLAVLVLNGKRVEVEPFGIELLTRTGLFDPHRIVRDCEVGRFPLVVAEYRLEDTPGLGECLARRYEAFAVLPPYRLLRPRPR